MSEIRILKLCHKKSILVDIYSQSLLSETISSSIGKARVRPCLTVFDCEAEKLWLTL